MPGRTLNARASNPAQTRHSSSHKAFCTKRQRQLGRELQTPYFDDIDAVKVEAVGYAALYDPENTKPRS